MNNNELGFDERQRKAAVYALYKIAVNDKDFDYRKMNTLKLESESLGEEFSQLSIADSMRTSAAKQVRILKSFSEKQKNWFVKAVQKIVNTEDHFESSEFSLVHSFFNAMNVSKEQVAQLFTLRRGTTYS